MSPSELAVQAKSTTPCPVKPPPPPPPSPKPPEGSDFRAESEKTSMPQAERPIMRSIATRRNRLISVVKRRIYRSPLRAYSFNYQNENLGALPEASRLDPS